MSPLVDYQIRKLAEEGMINPFYPERLNSMGYDITLGCKFKIPPAVGILDPLGIRPQEWEDYDGLSYIMPPWSFVLGISVERFVMPPDIIGICLGRSTYSRCGVVPHVTPLEPGWEGYITIEISNSGGTPVKLYANKGISQVVFLQGDIPLKKYSGKYQGQSEITLARGV